MRLSFRAGAMREPLGVLILAPAGWAAGSCTTISQLTRVSRDGSVETHDVGAIEWLRDVLLLPDLVEVRR